MRLARRLAPALIILCALGAAGCRVQSIPVGPGSEREWGMPVYYGEKVPFHYQQVGLIQVDCEGWSDEKTVRRMVKRARQLDADAVLHLEIDRSGEAERARGLAVRVVTRR